MHTHQCTKILDSTYLAASNFLIMWEVFSLALMYKGLFLFSSTSYNHSMCCLNTNLKKGADVFYENISLWTSFWLKFSLIKKLPFASSNASKTYPKPNEKLDVHQVIMTQNLFYTNRLFDGLLHFGQFPGHFPLFLLLLFDFLLDSLSPSVLLLQHIGLLLQFISQLVNLCFVMVQLKQL